MRSLLPAALLALLPGCAVIDGLGGEDEGSVPGDTNGPDSGGLVEPPRDGGFGEMDAATVPRVYEAQFTPPLQNACSPGFELAVVPFETAPDGMYDVTVGPLRLRGSASPSDFVGMIECSNNGQPFADMNAPASGGGYAGMYHVFETNVNGQLAVLPK